MLPVKPNLALPNGWEAMTYAEHQEQYLSLPVVRSQDERRMVVSRWMLTPGERAKIGEGHDIYLTMVTFGEPLQPVLMAVGAPTFEAVMPALTVRERVSELQDGLKASQEEQSRDKAGGRSSLDVVGTEGGKATQPVIDESQFHPPSKVS